MSGPNVFINCGKPEYFGAGLHSPSFVIDARGRLAYNDAAVVPTYHTVGGTQAYAATTTGRYFEIEVVSGGGTIRLQAGLVPDTTNVAGMGAMSNSGGAVCLTSGGHVYDEAGTLIETNTSAGTGDRIGIELIKIAGVDYARFTLNGSPNGADLALSAGKRWRPGFTSAAALNAGFAHFDRDDILYLRPGAQAWGSAMRISDVGGYTPAPVAAVALAAATTVAEHVVSATVSNRHVRFDRTHSGDRIYAFGVRLITMPTAGQNLQFGLATTAQSLTIALGGTGSNSASFAWASGANLSKRWNNVTGSIVGAGSLVQYDQFIVLWKPSSGGVWIMKNGTVLEGNPAAGTGPSLTITAGAAMYPVLSPASNGVMRISTHRAEIPGLPSYAEAWDDNDLLPDQHYKGRLAADTEIEETLWFPPWGGSRNKGTTLGAIKVANADGFYDGTRNHEIRNKPLKIMERIDGQMLRVVSVLCDNIVRERSSYVSLLSRDRAMLLDKHIERPIYSIGNTIQVPPKATTALSNAYDVASTPLLVSLTVAESGANVTSWRRGNADLVAGFQRTVAVVGKQSANFITARIIGAVPFTNGDFSAWAGDNPTGWTVTETGAADNRVTQSGSACRFIRGAATAEVRIQQGSIAATQLRAIRVEVTAYTSGSLTIVGFDGVLGPIWNFPLNINGTGTFWAIVDTAFMPATGAIRVVATDGTDLTITLIEHFRIERSAVFNGDPAAFFRGLLVDDGGLTELDYDISGLGPQTEVGEWSDQKPTVRQILESTLDGWMCDYYVDSMSAADGRIVFRELRAPEDSASTFELFEVDAVDDLSVEDDMAPALSDAGMEQYRFMVYAENELVGAITTPPATNVPFFVNQYQVNRLDLSGSSAAGDAWPFHSFYSHAVNAKPFARRCCQAISTNSTAASHADRGLFRLHRYYAQKRAFFERSYKASRVRHLQLGTIGTLQHTRHEASNKRVFLKGRRRRLLLQVWRLTFGG